MPDSKAVNYNQAPHEKYNLKKKRENKMSKERRKNERRKKTMSVDNISIKNQCRKKKWK
jgi:hypothetical protein